MKNIKINKFHNFLIKKIYILNNNNNNIKNANKKNIGFNNPFSYLHFQIKFTQYTYNDIQHSFW